MNYPNGLTRFLTGLGYVSQYTQLAAVNCHLARLRAKKMKNTSMIVSFKTCDDRFF
jgi:hypothetical protein